MRGIPRAVLRGVSFEVAPGRGLRAGRRVRLRQVDDRLRRAPLPARQRPDHRRPDPTSTATTSRRCRATSCASSATHHASMVYQDPGAALNPIDQDRPAGDRGFTVLGQNGEQARGQCPRGAQARPHRRPRACDAALPAPAVRRHAAARRDRDGAGVRPAAARARRADDRARRHGRGRACSTSFARFAETTPRSC